MPILPADDVVIVSIVALVEALSNGINCFLIDIYRDKNNISIFEERATEIFGTEKYGESI
ncbi:hypothetical protein [Paenibacillus oryzisoli]|uniref:hypothetical protein n=1 Tax=Paenibacillus oryzisoli TaxID=1850517 RepID=UPI00195CC7E1|nr:hypothetical protein [Paenibacillus oryzisoli]